MHPKTDATSAATIETPKLIRKALATRGSVAISQIPRNPTPDARKAS